MISLCMSSCAQVISKVGGESCPKKTTWTGSPGFKAGLLHIEFSLCGFRQPMLLSVSKFPTSNKRIIAFLSHRACAAGECIKGGKIFEQSMEEMDVL